MLAANGKIYFIPRNAEAVLVVDPDTDAFDTAAIAVTSGQGSWHGGTLVPSGRIYCLPSNAFGGTASVLIIDPATNTTDTTSIVIAARVGSMPEEMWSGGVAVNGKIYGIPSGTYPVLIIDPATNAVDTTSIVPSGEEGRGWSGGVLAPNGKIYCAPSYAARNVLIIDPATNTADGTTISGLRAGAGWGVVLAGNGKIYCMPSGAAPEAAMVLVIDPRTNTVRMLGARFSMSLVVFSGAVLGRSGWVLGFSSIPGPLLLAVDTATENVGTRSLMLPFGRWEGGVLAGNGNIYSAGSDSVLILRFLGDANSNTAVTPAPCEMRDKGVGYRGKRDFTASGALCVDWRFNFNFDLSLYPEAGLEDGAFCRNPDGKAQPWCFVRSMASPGWEYCDPCSEYAAA